METVGFESRTADQTAVDVSLRDQFFGVFGLHAAAVLNDGVFGNCAVEPGNHFADERMSCFRHVGSSGLACTDCPDRR